MPNFCICKGTNDRAYDLEDPTHHVIWTLVVDIQLLIPTEYTVSISPDIKAFGWVCKYINDQSLKLDLKWQYSNVENVQTVNWNVNLTKHKYGL